MRGQRFYTDLVEVIEKKKTSDGAGGTTTKDVVVGEQFVFIDTPTASEQFQINQMETDKFERYMYYPYGGAFKRGMRLQREEEGVLVKYEVVGKPENQGGRNQVMRAKLKEVP